MFKISNLIAKVRKNRFARSIYFSFNNWFSKQQSTQITNLFGYSLKLPSRHPLASMFKASPRDAMLAALSKVAFSKDLNHYIDVGANVGDSAVIIEHFSKAKLSGDLIEPSDFFFPFLVENSKLLHRPTLHQKFASTSYPTADINGILYHWPGNAEVVDASSKVLARIQDQVNVGDLIRAETALVKVDCEGLDVSIIDAALSNTRGEAPIFYFESTLKSEGDFNRLQNLFVCLDSNYDRVVVACPSGILIYGGKIDENFWRLATYQLKLHLLGQRERLYYVDIAVFPKARKLTFDSVLMDMDNFKNPKETY
jgi:FkbM family methyltransferase